MTKPLEQRIDDQQIDIFREIGNIGAGNAATALAGLLNKQIEMSIPEVAIVPFNDIVNILDGPENIAIGILVDMDGDLKGYTLLILGMRDAYQMTSIALGEDRPTPAQVSAADFGEMDLSALTEMANILVGSYLSAVCTMADLQVRPSVPQMTIDMVGAIISIVAIEYGQIGDSVLFLKTQFSDVSTDLTGHFFLIPDFESYKILMGSLGIGMGE